MGEYLRQQGGGPAAGGGGRRPDAPPMPRTNPMPLGVPDTGQTLSGASYSGVLSGIVPAQGRPRTPAEILAIQQKIFDQNNLGGGIGPQYRPGYVPPTPQQAAGGHHNTGSNAPAIDPAAPAGSNWGQPSWWPTRVQDTFDPLGGSPPRKVAPQRQRGPAGKA